ncbi:response regulator transcription factor [Tessaracoccus antarcticus]|uniref:DNA-binding response regulator n=1 Tax=Tessaracoccus antarcticus TaxID=2479848 RepID=A0A3M0G6A4_9ACTN|nr:response regulator transcription factor [Tessaracoccus antarcticus]RMB59647.1 DNA-binding response regulator [Tessaracoccus antarcticus]
MTDAADRLRILLFSDDRTVREEVRLTLGRKVASDLPEIDVVEVATGPALLRTLDAGTDYALIILDAEAQPEGGMGLAHQIKDEYSNCPPVLLLVARLADAWLATWSRAEAISPYPVDPLQLPEQVAGMLRRAIVAP